MPSSPGLGKKKCGECGEKKNPVDGLVRIYGPPQPRDTMKSVCRSCIPDVVPWLFNYSNDIDVRCAFCDTRIKYFLWSPSGVNPYCTSCIDRDTMTALDHLAGSLETELKT